MNKTQQLLMIIAMVTIFVASVVTVVSNTYYAVEKINEVKNQCVSQIQELEQACKDSCAKQGR